MASVTPDLLLPPQPQGITAPRPLPNYTARWQRHTCVNNLPRVVAWKRNGRYSNPSCKCNAWTSMPLGHIGMGRSAMNTTVGENCWRKCQGILLCLESGHLVITGCIFSLWVHATCWHGSSIALYRQRLHRMYNWLSVEMTDCQLLTRGLI